MFTELVTWGSKALFFSFLMPVVASFYFFFLTYSYSLSISDIVSIQVVHIHAMLLFYNRFDSKTFLRILSLSLVRGSNLNLCCFLNLFVFLLLLTFVYFSWMLFPLLLSYFFVMGQLSTPYVRILKQIMCTLLFCVLFSCFVMDQLSTSYVGIYK